MIYIPDLAADENKKNRVIHTLLASLSAPHRRRTGDVLREPRVNAGGLAARLLRGAGWSRSRWLVAMIFFYSTLGQSGGDSIHFLNSSLLLAHATLNIA